MRKIALLAIMCLPFIASPAQAGDGDPRAGKDQFRKCLACHKVGPEAKNSVGPMLNGIVGRKANTVKGYNYSALNQAAGESGLVWTEQDIFTYLAGPQEFLVVFATSKGVDAAPLGRTKMVFKLADEQARRDIIAYLKTIPAAPAP